MVSKQSELPRTGMILGKFLPPHAGHRLLVDFARHQVAELTVLVCTLQAEPIPGELRVAWMREMFPAVRVVQVTDENPQYPHEHPDFWAIWLQTIRRVLPVGPDLLFASEDYGVPLAELLGATYVPVDPAREQIPVAGHQIREDPMRWWRFIPECVRSYFVRRLAIIGPESTGKSTLARQLAARFDTIQVAEYARIQLESTGLACTREDIEGFVGRQRAAEEALARQANRVLICDTDAFTTCLWHQLILEEPAPAWMWETARGSRYHRYLITRPDVPYVDDPQRHHPRQREWFFAQCLAYVRERGAPYRVLEGAWPERWETACQSVVEMIDS